MINVIQSQKFYKIYPNGDILFNLLAWIPSIESHIQEKIIV